LTNIYQDITHIGEAQEKTCEICGLPMAKSRKKYHKDCKRALDSLRRKMKRKQGDVNHNEVEYRWMMVKEGVEWLLDQDNRRVKRIVGDQGENALLAFRIYLRREA
jgi:hypothetical protein